MLMEESKSEKSTMEVGIVSEETVQNKIYTVRGYKVMLDMSSIEKQMCDVMNRLEDVVTKSDLAEMMDSFVDKEDNGWLMYNTKYCAADLAYSEIYGQARLYTW